MLFRSSVSEKELLAIIFGCKTFRPYLYGRRFSIITDHQPLKWLFNHTNPSSKLQRWRLTLEEFDYEIIYRKGRLNSAADALSRYPVQNITSNEPDEANLNAIQDPLELIASPNPEIGNPDSPINIQDPLQYVNPPSPEPSTSRDNPDPNPDQDSSPAIPEDVLDDSYSKFLRNFTNSNYNTVIIEHNGNLLKTQHKTIAIPISLDLDESIPYIQEVLGNYPNVEQVIQSEKSLHSNATIKIGETNFYLMYTKVHHFETTSYTDIFETLKNLRNELLICSTDQLTDLAISDFRNPFDKHSYVKIYNMITYLFHNTHIKIHLYKNNIIYPSPSVIPKILRENHDIPIAGHLGSSRMLSRVREQYHWKNMRSDIETYVKNCSLCQTNKALRKINRAPMQITSTSTSPFQRLSLDIVGPLPEAGNAQLRFILTLQDDLTKFSAAYPLSIQPQKKQVNA